MAEGTSWEGACDGWEDGGCSESGAGTGRVGMGARGPEVLTDRSPADRAWLQCQLRHGAGDVISI